MVDIDGIDLVLAAKPDVKSGVTTLFADGATLGNRTLYISPENTLIFGEEPLSRRQRRGLASSSGEQSLLVVRVSTNDAQLRADRNEMSDNVFGTFGDQVNFKNNAEQCSNNEVTIEPATRTGTGCLDKKNFKGSAKTRSGNDVNCNWFSYMEVYYPNVYCPMIGNWPDTGGGPETANTACCACGGGDIQVFDGQIVDGVYDLHVNINAENTNRHEIEEAAEQQLLNSLLTTNLNLLFDLVMICIPQGTYRPSDSSKGWRAYAYVGGWLSVFNGDDNCRNPAAHAHESKFS